MWRIPPERSAGFVYHMGDVLEVYHRPYDPERPVVCVDETSKQLVGEVRAPLPSRPGVVARYDGEYARNGAASLFLAFEPLAGWRHVAVAEGRKRGDRARLVAALLEGRCAEAERLVLVMDQLDTHPPASLCEIFPPERAKRPADRLETHHTPEHGSRPNTAEIEFSALARDLPERVGNGPDPERHAAARERRRNDAGVAADWRFTTAGARIEPRKLYPTIDA